MGNLIKKGGTGVRALQWLMGLGLMALVASACGGRKTEAEGGTAFDPVLACVEQDGKWGLIDRSGAFVLPPTLRNSLLFPYFTEGLLAVNTDDLPAEGVPPGEPRYGYIDHRAHYVIAPRFEAALPFCNGLAACMMNGRWGFIDTSGTFVIPPKFKATTGYFTEGLCAVSDSLLTGYINIDGEWAVTPKYHAAGLFANGLAPVAVREAGKTVWGYVDKKGQEVIYPKFAAAQPFYGDWAVAQDAASGLWGYINRSGAWALEPAFDLARPFVGPVALVGKKVTAAAQECEYAYYLIGKNGEPGWGSRFVQMFDFSVAETGLLPAATKLPGGESGTQEAILWGFADVNSGKWVVQPQYVVAGDFSYGLAKVYKGGQAGFVDTKGNAVINPQYTNATDFHNISRNHLLERRLLQQSPCLPYY